MTAENNGVDIRNIIEAAATGNRLALLITSYQEADPVRATGSIIETLLEGDDNRRYLLNTNDRLTTMRSSPPVTSGWEVPGKLFGQQRR